MLLLFPSLSSLHAFVCFGYRHASNGDNSHRSATFHADDARFLLTLISARFMISLPDFIAPSMLTLRNHAARPLMHHATGN